MIKYLNDCVKLSEMERKDMKYMQSDGFTIFLHNEQIKQKKENNEYRKKDPYKLPCNIKWHPHNMRGQFQTQQYHMILLSKVEYNYQCEIWRWKFLCMTSHSLRTQTRSISAVLQPLFTIKTFTLDENLIKITW